MTTFDERERAFENKYAHDAELKYRVEARAVNNLALWAGRQRGLKDAALVDYARAVLGLWLSKPGEAHVFERLVADGLGAEAARARHAELLLAAKREIMAE